VFSAAQWLSFHHGDTEVTELLNFRIKTAFTIKCCDTTERKAVCTIVVVGGVHVATIEVQVVSIGAILCTTPVVAVVATVVENAIGVVAVASCRHLALLVESIVFTY
jgi:hypothetical protein